MPVDKRPEKGWENIADDDWESIYQGRSGLVAEKPPWNIGEPQPAMVELERQGKFRSEVLDAGCGVGETVLYLIAKGYRAIGVDFSASAIAEARGAAEQRGLSAEFWEADISKLSGCDGRFQTILDSTLFHALSLDLREGYIRSIARAAAPGASYFLLTFSHEAVKPGFEFSEHSVSESELEQLVGEHFQIDDIKPAVVHTGTPQTLSPVFETHHFPVDEQGRAQLPAWLLTAHAPN
ncbi:MAG: class I SAM-dependent methyltransferase [Segniliparus sp.]|uniref:class I SAM-dependent methyltransferase n=1 Tax=Segniliparus sp. TaxID=2804064 RepID=UPI003F2A434A